MRNNRNRSIDLHGHIIIVGNEKVHNVLQDEEQQRKDDPDFGTSYEDLDEETLDDENDVK